MATTIWIRTKARQQSINHIIITSISKSLNLACSLLKNRVPHLLWWKRNWHDGMAQRLEKCLHSLSKSNFIQQSEISLNWTWTNWLFFGYSHRVKWLLVARTRRSSATMPAVCIALLHAQKTPFQSLQCSTVRWSRSKSEGAKVVCCFWIHFNFTIVRLVSCFPVITSTGWSVYNFTMFWL